MFNVGDKVKVLDNTWTAYSADESGKQKLYKRGDIGYVTEVDFDTYRVSRTNDPEEISNWMPVEQLELVEEATDCIDPMNYIFVWEQRGYCQMFPTLDDAWDKIRRTPVEDLPDYIWHEQGDTARKVSWMDVMDAAKEIL